MLQIKACVIDIKYDYIFKNNFVILHKFISYYLTQTKINMTYYNEFNFFYCTELQLRKLFISQKKLNKLQ